MKLKNLNVYIKTKVVFKFDSLKRLYMEMRTEKLFKSYHKTDTCEIQTYIHVNVCTCSHTCERPILVVKSVKL